MKRLLFPFLALLLLLTACGEQASQQQFFAMDTVMSITAYGSGAEEAIHAAVEKINTLEGLLSRTREDSEIAALSAAAPEAVSISEDTARVLSLAVEWNQKTGGAFDVTITPVLTAWGFGGEGEYRVPSPEELEELLTLVDSSLLLVDGNTAALGKAGMGVDLGGIAKGYAAGRADQVLREHGVESALLDLGHNITVIGSRPDGSPWRIAIQDPQDSSAAVGILFLEDCSAVTSGGYQRYFEQDGILYHHILDPRTGYPADSGILSATVVCADPGLADLLSTAVFVLGEEDALELWRAEGGKYGFELVLVTEEGRVVLTQGLSELFQEETDSGYTVEYAG